jgi:hypothetical protein
MELQEQLETLRLRLTNTQLQAQSLERDVVVLNYARLLGEAQGLREGIMKLEEEVRRDEELKNSVGIEPIDPDPTAE